jgi:hypothetical protein
MRLLTHKAERRGNGEMKMSGLWSDHMRRPAQVSISWGPLEHSTDELQDLIEGDVKQCTDILFSIADMAWSQGWRPRGLPGALASFCQVYQIPPEEK